MEEGDDFFLYPLLVELDERVAFHARNIFIKIIFFRLLLDNFHEHFFRLFFPLSSVLSLLL